MSPEHSEPLQAAPAFDAAARLDATLAERRAAQRKPDLQPARALTHREAKARALAVLTGGDPLIAARDAFDNLAARNRELLAEGGDAIREALADQVAILETLVCGFAVQAGSARRADDAKAFASVAIRASGALTQTLAVLHRMTEDRRNAEAIPA